MNVIINTCSYQFSSFPQPVAPSHLSAVLSSAFSIVLPIGLRLYFSIFTVFTLSFPFET